MDTRRIEGIQNMSYDARQDCWVAIGHQPAYKRASILVRVGRVLLGAAKATIMVAIGVAACGLFYEAAPWYTRAWSAVTGSFPWLWPF